MDASETTFGQQLRRLRLQHGLSQEALAERAGLTPSAVAALERGRRRRPYPRTIDRLAEALDLADHVRAAFCDLAGGSTHSADRDVAGEPPVGTPLPVWPTSLLGRQADVREIRNLLNPSGSGVRLLSLIGPGGVGKTRLAVAAAEVLAPLYPDGVVFVDLAPVREVSMVPATIAHALDLRESRGRSAHQLLLDHLRSCQGLLVLDNFEHLLEAAPLLAELLGACPTVRLLVTSRATLRLSAEQRFHVAPLATPAENESSAAAVAATPAVRLFTERARTVAPEFMLEPPTAAMVGAICRRLDGMPLAIELAAARLALLSPSALLRRLERRLPLLVGGAADLPERQQTLRQTLAWSYDLLRPTEQILFKRLAVFAAGWTLEAAEAVCPDDALPAEDLLDHLQVLIDSSLVRVQRIDDNGGEPRFGLLETVHEFAQEQLELGDDVETQRERHAAYFLALTRTAEPEVRGARQLVWLARLDREQANLREALSWYLGHDPPVAAELAGRLWQFWRLRGHYAEGLAWLNRGLAAAPGQSVAWARAALGAGVLARDLGDMATAHTHLTASLTCSRALGELELVAHALRDLAGWHVHRSAFGSARPLLREALVLARATGDQLGVAGTLMFQAQVAASGGSTRRAQVLNQAGLAAARAVGDRWLMAAILLQLGSLAVDAGELESAVPLLEEGLAVSCDLGVPTRVGQFQWQLGRIALLRGELDRALPLLETLRVASRERQSPRGTAAALVDVARVAHARGARTEALALLREALRLRDGVSDRVGSIECLELLAAVDAAVDPLYAAWLLGAAAAGRRALGAPPWALVRQELETTRRTARAAVGAATFDEAQAAGQLASLEHAIVQALQDRGWSELS